MTEFDRIVTDPRMRHADAEKHLASEQAGEPMLKEYHIVGSGGTIRQARCGHLRSAGMGCCGRQPVAHVDRVWGIAEGAGTRHRRAHFAAHDQPPVC